MSCVDCIWQLGEKLDVTTLNTDQCVHHQQADIVANLKSVMPAKATRGRLAVNSVTLGRHRLRGSLDGAFEW